MIHLMDCVEPNRFELFLRKHVYPKIPGYQLPTGPMEYPVWAARLMGLGLPMDYRCIHNAADVVPVFSTRRLDLDTYVFAVAEDNAELVGRCIRECTDIGATVLVGGCPISKPHLLAGATWYETLEGLASRLILRPVERLIPCWERFAGGTVLRLHVDGSCPWSQCVFCSGIPDAASPHSTPDELRGQAYRLAKGKPSYVYWDEKMFPWTEDRSQLMESLLSHELRGARGFVVQTNPQWLPDPRTGTYAWTAVRVVELGLEAFNTEALAFLNKPHAYMSDKDYTERLQWVGLALGAYVLPYILLGVPFQDPQQVVAELHTMKTLFGDKMPGVQLNWLSAYPGTPLEQWCKERFGHVTAADRSQLAHDKTWLTEDEQQAWLTAERDIMGMFS